MCSNYNFSVPTIKEPTALPNPSPEERIAEIHGRILALDFGTRRIGMAVSDPLGITAQGLPTLTRKNKRTDLALLKDVLTHHQIREIVVGLPLRLSGAESSSTAKAREFAELIHKEFSLPVHLWDERFTSVEANRVLRESEMSIRKRGEAVDRLSAVLILQAFLARRQQRI